MKILVLYLVGGPLKQLHMLIGTITSAFAKASLQQCSVDEREHLSLSAKRVPKQDQCGTTAGQTVPLSQSVVLTQLPPPSSTVECFE